MRWALVVVGLALAGCAHDKPGLLVEVSGPNLAKVVLYLSGGSCGSGCPSITPPNMVKLEGTGWIVDDLLPYTVENIGGGVARFFLDNATGADLSVARILAVGHDKAGNTMVATIGPVTVPAFGAIAKITLAPADAINSTSHAEHLLEWPRRTTIGMTSCAVIHHHDSSSIEFFVPKDDTDCDDVVNECDPFAWVSPQIVPPVGLPNASCVTPTTSCVIGGKGCSEANPGISDHCVPLASPTYCLPEQLCSNAGPAAGCPYDNTCLEPLVKSFGTTGSNMPRIDCTLAFMANGTPCASTYVGPIEAALVSGGKCKSIEIGEIKIPPTFADSGPLMGGASYSIMSFKSDTCSASLKITGLTPLGTSLMASAMALVVTETDVNRVVPIYLFAQRTGCPTPPLYCNSVMGAGPDGTSVNSLYSCQ